MMTGHRQETLDGVTSRQAGEARTHQLCRAGAGVRAHQQAHYRRSVCRGAPLYDTYMGSILEHFTM